MNEITLTWPWLLTFMKQDPRIHYTINNPLKILREGDLMRCCKTEPNPEQYSLFSVTDRWEFVTCLDCLSQSMNILQEQWQLEKELDKFDFSDLTSLFGSFIQGD